MSQVNIGYTDNGIFMGYGHLYVGGRFYDHFRIWNNIPQEGDVFSALQEIWAVEKTDHKEKMLYEFHVRKIGIQRSSVS